MEEKDTKVVLANEDVDKIKTYIKEADNQLKKLNSTFLLAEQNAKQDKLDNFIKKVKSVLKRIDVKSGINVLKIVLWIAMAWTIVTFSNDINAKIIGALTFFMGLVIDMMLLRKQLPQDGYTIFRLVVGAFSLLFWVIIVILIASLMNISMGGNVTDDLDSYINIALYACGIFSTLLEFINSIAMDD